MASLSMFERKVFKNTSFLELTEEMLYLDKEIQKKSYREVALEPIAHVHYKGNFYALLQDLNVDPDLYLYTLYLNNYTSPYDFGYRREKTIKIPNSINIAT